MDEDEVESIVQTVIPKERADLFPTYKQADVEALMQKFLLFDYQGLAREILKMESLLSVYLLIKKILRYFNRRKVTKYVRQDFYIEMSDCQRNSININDAFAYITNTQNEIAFRMPSKEVKRKVDELLQKNWQME